MTQTSDHLTINTVEGGHELVFPNGKVVFMDDLAECFSQEALILHHDVVYVPGDKFFTVKGQRIDFHEIQEPLTESDPETGETWERLVVKFKMERNPRNIRKAITEGDYIFRPDLTAYQLILLRCECGSEARGNYWTGFWDHAEKKAASKSFIRRLINEGGIRFNGRVLKHDQVVDFPVFSIVAFPKSDKFYNTIF